MTVKDSFDILTYSKKNNIITFYERRQDGGDDANICRDVEFIDSRGLTMFAGQIFENQFAGLTIVYQKIIFALLCCTSLRSNAFGR